MKCETCEYYFNCKGNTDYSGNTKHKDIKFCLLSHIYLEHIIIDKCNKYKKQVII
jgi:hypothetical protein